MKSCDGCEFELGCLTKRMGMEADCEIYNESEDDSDRDDGNWVHDPDMEDQ